VAPRPTARAAAHRPAGSPMARESRRQ
jgi:hypothetical protein